MIKQDTFKRGQIKILLQIGSGVKMENDVHFMVNQAFSGANLKYVFDMYFAFQIKDDIWYIDVINTRRSFQYMLAVTFL